MYPLLKRCFVVSVLVTVLIGVVPRPSEAQPVECAATGHRYEYVPYSFTWAQANAAATAAGGHLATIQSAEENGCVSALIPQPLSAWLGGWQPSGGGRSEPGAGWKWITEEPFGSYTNWTNIPCCHEPNDAGGGVDIVGREDHLGMSNYFDRVGTWFDIAGGAPFGYIVEFEAVLPLIESLSSYMPNAGVAGRPVVINGQNFGSTQGQVKFALLNAAITLWSDTQIRATVPGLLQIGPHAVVVTTSTGADSSPVFFEVKTLANAAIDLAKSVVGGRYLGDGDAWGGKGWDYDSQRNTWASPEQIKDLGYIYFNFLQPTSNPSDTGLDCSGLIFWAYNKAFGAPTYQASSNPVYFEGANDQYWWSTDDVAEADLVPGDLVFRSVSNSINSDKDHVALFVGDGGCGSNDCIIEASGAANNPNAIRWNTLANFKSVFSLRHVAYGRLRANQADLIFNSYSPIGLQVRDPNGNTIRPETFERTALELRRNAGRSLNYSVPSFDASGQSEDRVTAPAATPGIYSILPLPKTGALPDDTYTLEAVAHPVPVTLAQDVAIADIPAAGYAVRIEENGSVTPVSPIEIDVLPSDPRNRINPKRRGRIEVVIKTTESFDATSVDWNSVRFGKTGIEAAAKRAFFRDVDRKQSKKRRGYVVQVDMVLEFSASDIALTCDTTAVSLTGQTVDGRAIGGLDLIKTVGCHRKRKSKEHADDDHRDWR